MLDRLQHLITPPSFPDEENKARSARLLNSVLIAGIFIDSVASIALYTFFGSPLSTLTLNLILLILMVTAWLFLHFQHIVLASGVLILAIFAYTTMAMYFFGGLGSSVTSTMLVLIVVAELLMGRWGAIGTSVLVFISMFGILYLQQSQQLPPPLSTPSPTETLMVFAAQVAALVATVYMSNRNLVDALRRTRDEVAERVQIENSLRESGQRLKTIYDNTTVGITLSTPEGGFVFCNTTLIQMLGYSASELAFVTFESITHPDDLPKERELRAQIERGEINSYQLAKRYRTKTSTDLWVRVNVACQRDDQGKVKFYTGIVEDITDRKRAEEERLKFRLGIERTGDAIVLTDRNGVISYINPAFTRIYGYTQDEVIGKTPRILKSGRASPQVYENLWDALLKKQVFSMEIINLTKDGRLVQIESTANPIVSETGEILGFLAIHRDISERKKAEHERETLIQQLEAKNAELERFTYTVSHDLKSPLITIAGFLSVLEKDALAGNTARIKADLIRISSAAEKMKHLLDDVLELSRIGRLMNPPEPVPFANLVQESIFLVQGRIQARKVLVHVEPELPTVYGDRERLVEVVQNLIDNAIKFMGDQKEPRIEIGMDPETRDGKATFFVRDNGVGIRPEFHSRVFGLFNKLDPQTEGTGVGLALVKRIVQVHGGDIWVESEGLAKGTTFYFTLPLAQKN